MSELTRAAALMALFPLRYYAYLTERRGQAGGRNETRSARTWDAGLELEDA